MLINKHFLTQLGNKEELILKYSIPKEIYIVFYETKPVFKDSIMDINNVLYYVVITINDITELLKLTKKSVRYDDSESLTNCIDDYSSKIVYEIIEAFKLKAFGDLPTKLYFNILIPKFKDLEFGFKNKEGKVKFNFNDKPLQSNILPGFN